MYERPLGGFSLRGIPGRTLLIFDVLQPFMVAYGFNLKLGQQTR